MKRRLNCLVLVLVMVLSCTSIPTYADTVASGTCGENLTWILNSEGVLTISGKGDMEDYQGSLDVPWLRVRSSIEKIVIEPGVTSIGDFAFFDCPWVTSVVIPNGVTKLGLAAMDGMIRLPSVELPNGLTEIHASCFYGCSSLTDITIPRDVTAIFNYAFFECDNLSNIYYGGSEADWETISIGINNDPLSNATFHYNHEGAANDEASNDGSENTYGNHIIKMKIGSPYIDIDGRISNIDDLGTTPVIINSRTLLPIRAVIEAMGGNVGWIAAERKVVLKIGDKTLNLTIDSLQMFGTDGKTYTIDTAPVIIGGRTMLPVRAIVEYFGGTVAWDASTKTVTIVYGQPMSKINYYKVFDNVVTSWEAAEQYCESLGGHLATLTSKEENDFVYQMVRNAGYNSAYFGLTDKDVENTWRWVTGESNSYTNWHSGEPNHENANEDYAMFYYKYDSGAWNDGDFGGKTANGGMAFICEWDSLEAYSSYLRKSSYISVIEEILKTPATISEFGLLYDVDNDGIEELILSHEGTFTNKWGDMPAFAYSAYDFDNGELVTIANGECLVPCAGGSGGHAGVLVGEKTYLYTLASASLGNGTSEVTYKLYDPSTFSLLHTLYNHPSGTYTIDGQNVTKEMYDNVLAGVRHPAYGQYQNSGWIGYGNAMELSELMEHLKTQIGL